MSVQCLGFFICPAFEHIHQGQVYDVSEQQTLELAYPDRGAGTFPNV